MIQLKRIQARIALLERDVVATEALVNKVSVLPMDEARVKRLASLERLLESRRRHLKKAKWDLQHKAKQGNQFSEILQIGMARRT